MKGRVASLLEVGTGFHPELSGRENIYLNGTILGMKRHEIARRFDQIVAFSEVEDFLDTPVKRYSSGMFVRLAFAVAAHLDPEILIVDEVLAVGDTAFQKKCLGRMKEISQREGRTVFFVSHNLTAVRTLCNRAILLEDGLVAMDSGPKEVIARYLNGVIPDGVDGLPHYEWTAENAPAVDELRMKSVSLLNTKGETSVIFAAGEDIRVDIRYEILQRLRGFRFYLVVYTQEGDMAFVATDHNSQNEALDPGLHHTVFTVPGGLLNRRGYVFSLSCDQPGHRHMLSVKLRFPFTVGGVGNQASPLDEEWPGVLCPRISSVVERLDSASA
jgi:lipopolysaccharide transport system ATP-binding protein